MAIHESTKSEIYYVGKVGFFATSDYIIIEEDEFRSGYECTNCVGVGKVTCTRCHGTGESGIVAGAKCSQCEGSGVDTCEVCYGKGGLLVVPEQSQRRPTTGKIVSVGPDTKQLQVGANVLYSNFSGHAIDLRRATGQKVVLRILHEKEVLSGVVGHLELSGYSGVTDIKTI